MSLVFVCLFIFSVCDSHHLIHAEIAASPATKNCQPYLDRARELQHIDANKSIMWLEHINPNDNDLSDEDKIAYLRLYLLLTRHSNRHQKQIDFIGKLNLANLSKETQILIKYNLSESYNAMGEYEKSIKLIQENLIAIQAIDDYKQKMEVYLSMYNFLRLIGLYEEALQYGEKIKALKDESNNYQITCVYQSMQTEIAYLKGDYQKNTSHLADTIYNCEKANYFLLNRIVKIMEASGRLKYQPNNDHLHHALQLHKEITQFNPDSEYRTLLEGDLAQFYLRAGDKLEAKKYLDSAYDISYKTKTLDKQILATQGLVDYYNAQHNYQKAWEYQSLIQNLQNQFINDRTKRILAYQKVRIENQEKIHELEITQQKNNLLNIEKTLDLQNKRHLWLSIISIMILGSLVVLVLAFALKQRNAFKRVSETDNLTNISNRAHFIRLTHRLFSARTGIISIVIMDMDHFKKVNDSYGHAVGDWLLKETAQTIQQCLRSGDILGRLGGEEFALCLPDTVGEQALYVAERCRAAIEQIDTQASGVKFQATASFGVAVADLSKSPVFNDIYMQADHALYVSKNQGRNQVNMYREEKFTE